MLPLKTQIPLQEKIAELERRICVLEEQFGIASPNPFDDEEVKSHWKEMWKHFDAVMNRVFPKRRK